MNTGLLYLLVIICILSIVLLVRGKKFKPRPQSASTNFKHAMKLNQKWHKPGYRKTILDRHFSLLQRVQAAYKERKTSVKKRVLCEKLAWQHLEEFQTIRPILIEWRKDYSGEKHNDESLYLPLVPTFEYLATVLTEKGEHEKAVEVCKQAIAYGLQDRTKGGYEGRIQRIMRKQQKEGKFRRDCGYS